MKNVKVPGETIRTVDESRIISLMSLEKQLERLADLGLRMNPCVTVDDLLYSHKRINASIPKVTHLKRSFLCSETT
ncbi:MAG: hypothetical protein NTW52_01530 [Planctomycetota bacterium]|nr:hypothetical protein [Planctomycetota bacterium]